MGVSVLGSGVDFQPRFHELGMPSYRGAEYTIL